MNIKGYIISNCLCFDTSSALLRGSSLINDAIAIENSDILGLTNEEKRKLNEIISLSMLKKIDKLRKAANIDEAKRWTDNDLLLN
jgi:hypothetical protein